MATFTDSVAEINTAANTFYGWAVPISNFFSTAGWKQQADTGQVVWPAGLFNITDANGNGTTVTFTGTVTNGPSTLRVGQQIKVSGTTSFGTVGTPVVYTVNGGNLTTTWTALSGTTAHDAAIAANTGWGSIYVLATMTAVTGNGATATYTYTNTDGTVRAGQSIVIPQTGTTGFTNAGFNGTFTVLTANGTSFTATNGTNSSETKTVTGQVVTLPGAIAASESTTTTLPPATGSSLYEIWGMGDALQSTFPVIIRIGYSTNSAATTNPALNITGGTATDGAGNITGVTTGSIFVIANSLTTGNATPQPRYLSGSTNRITMSLWPTVAGNARVGFVNIERSHDTSGADTSTYATINVFNPVPLSSQISWSSTAVTTTQTKWAGVITTGAGTASFGSSTEVAPLFPLVGALGNPLINVFIGKSTDWTDQTQFSFTIYNTAHNYIVNNVSPVTTANNLLPDSSATCCIISRYD